MELVQSEKSVEIMHITDGYHYHTIYAEFKEILEQIEQVLTERSCIVSES